MKDCMATLKVMVRKPRSEQLAMTNRTLCERDLVESRCTPLLSRLTADQS